jgi:hypothetical protein
MMFWDSLLEAVMLICFAAAWPASIHKSWTSRTRKGKSLFFLGIVFIGYAAGITRIVLRADGSFLIIPYTFNALLVTCDLLIYYRNYRIDEHKPPLIPQSTRYFLKDYFQYHRWRDRL